MVRKKRLIQAASVAIFFVAWQIVGMNTDPILFATPIAVVAAMVEIVINGDLPRALMHSLILLLSGFLLSGGAGVALGVLMGRVSFIERLLTPYIFALYASPMIALIPILMIWFGSGDRAKIAAVFLNSVFVVILNTMQGVKYTDKRLIEAAASFGISEMQMFTKVVLPAALPHVAAGLRLSAGKAVVGLIAAELFLTLSGLGGLLQRYGASFHTPRLFAVIVAIALIGAALITLTKWLEHWAAPWQKSMDRS